MKEQVFLEEYTLTGFFIMPSTLGDIGWIFLVLG